MLSLNEICTYEISEDNKKPIYSLTLIDEPKTFVVSSNYFVASFGTYIQIFRTTDEKGNTLAKIQGKKKEFNSNITQIALNNNYMSILSDGKIHFIRLKTDNTEKIFPLKDTEDQIYYICMTEDYLIYSDSNGRIKIYSIFDNCLSIGDYR